MLSAASHLQIFPVVEACADFLYREIDLENCVDIATISETFTLPHLRKHAYCFIGEHLDQLMGYREFQQRTQLCQLQFLLKGNFPITRPEADVLEAILLWLLHDLKNREETTETLIKLINLPEIPICDMVAVFDRIMDGLEGDISENKSFIENLRVRFLTMSESQRCLVQTEASRVGVVNLRGLQKALVNIGGFQSSVGATNSLTYLHHGSRVWRKLTAIPHVNQSNFGVAVMNNELYVVGGIFSQSMQEIAHPFGFCYDPLTNTWRSIAAMDFERCGFYLASTNGKLYAIGGREDVDETPSECYDPKTDSWTLIAGLPGALERHAGAVIGNNIYISGGMEWGEVSDSLWRYNVLSDTWSQTAPLLFPRADHGMVAHECKLYIVGGWNESPTGQRILSEKLDMYDEQLDTWVTISLVPNPRYLSSLVCSNDKLHFIGGRCIDGGFYGASGKVDVYDLRSNDWSQHGDYPVELWEHLSCELYVPLSREDQVFKNNSKFADNKSLW